MKESLRIIFDIVNCAGRPAGVECIHFPELTLVQIHICISLKFFNPYGKHHDQHLIDQNVGPESCHGFESVFVGRKCSWSSIR